MERIKLKIDLDTPKYPQRDVVKSVPIPPVALRTWAARGHVVPDVEASGRGTENRYSAATVIKIGIMHHLTSMGFTPGNAEGFAKAMVDFVRVLQLHDERLFAWDARYGIICSTLSEPLEVESEELFWARWGSFMEMKEDVESLMRIHLDLYALRPDKFEGPNALRTEWALGVQTDAKAEHEDFMRLARSGRSAPPSVMVVPIGYIVNSIAVRLTDLEA